MQAMTPENPDTNKNEFIDAFDKIDGMEYLIAQGKKELAEQMIINSPRQSIRLLYQTTLLLADVRAAQNRLPTILHYFQIRERLKLHALGGEEYDPRWPKLPLWHLTDEELMSRWNEMISLREQYKIDRQLFQRNLVELDAFQTHALLEMAVMHLEDLQFRKERAESKGVFPEMDLQHQFSQTLLARADILDNPYVL
mgnify:CR=1 FL=1